MALSIKTREKEGIPILDLRGRLTVGEEVATFRETLSAQIEGGQTRLILNLEDVEYIDSTGLGSLVICFTRMQRAGGVMKLLNLNRRNIELLILTKLTTVFEIFNDEQDAVNSFFPDREIQKFDILSFVQSRSEE
jgi:anti-sigma B factor antagonist